MSWRRKIGLSALMGGGLVAGICGALKTVQVQTAYSSGDISYNVYPLLVTTLVESWIILILAVIPPLRYLFVKVFQKMKSGIARTAASDYGMYGRSHMPTSRGSVRLSNVNKIPGGSVIWHQKPADGMVADIENESEEEMLPREKRGSVRYAHVITKPGAPDRDSAGIIVRRDYDVRYELVR